MTNPGEDPKAPALYGRFSARLRAFYIDVIVLLVAMAIALTLATMSGSQSASRIIGFSFVALLVLFEPILVSAFGSSVGHYLNNLRVVDDRTGGRISFLKALARTAVKTGLGLYSFITMATTSRHQALHDWLTRSTVQIRDPAKARSSDYVAARTEPPAAGMPSPARRILVTLGYLVLIYLSTGVPQILLTSNRCIMADACSTQENMIRLMVGVVGLAVGAVVIVWGWRGKLYGCRRGQDGMPA